MNQPRQSCSHPQQERQRVNELIDYVAEGTSMTSSCKFIWTNLRQTLVSLSLGQTRS